MDKNKRISKRLARIEAWLQLEEGPAKKKEQRLLCLKGQSKDFWDTVRELSGDPDIEMTRRANNISKAKKGKSFTPEHIEANKASRSRTTQQKYFAQFDIWAKLPDGPEKDSTFLHYTSYEVRSAEPPPSLRRVARPVYRQAH